MTRALLAVILLTLAACKSGGERSWYSGPAELKAQTEHGINAALAELPREIGRPLKWDWSRDRVTVRLLAAAGRSNGWPTIKMPNGQQVYGYTIGNVIYLPNGFERRTLIHECGHVVLFRNGNADIAWHHSLPFFKRY
jgi:hypothetical protein